MLVGIKSISIVTVDNLESGHLPEQDSNVLRMSITNLNFRETDNEIFSKKAHYGVRRDFSLKVDLSRI